ncbi:MAG: hypothetical protein ABEH88_10520 [Halobacteriales archaeon]
MPEIEIADEVYEALAIPETEREATLNRRVELTVSRFGLLVRIRVDRSPDRYSPGTVEANSINSSVDPYIEPTASVDGDPSLRFELSEFIINPVIGEIQLFSKVFDRLRGVQRDEQRVLKTVRDEPIRDWRDNIVTLIEDIERIEHSKREELAGAVFLGLDLL